MNLERGYPLVVKEIVVGYDGSEESERALVRAADLAEALSSHLVVVTVTQPAPPVAPALELAPPGAMLVPGATGPVAIPSVETPTPETVSERLPTVEELAERQFERARVALAERTLDAEYLSEVGDPAERLLEVGARRGADLLVVGSSEHGFFERLFSRPVEETVARRAETDVLLVH